MDTPSTVSVRGICARLVAWGVHERGSIPTADDLVPIALCRRNTRGQYDVRATE
ncbi:hypothetical protein PMIN01_10011 [Paraphaeosphaeria minitans]|uniref:Uncharacterized protein n=1 Tax=Paraphaeosphaeria minitans TaxID=565426 RepID=A0A9P6KML2_9PLEO|nr:hypothetical protein PMIN01_10011 [Paraphaeosphaeria minitans]